MQAGDAGEVPIGAVVVHRGRVVASAGNAMEGSGESLDHELPELISANCLSGSYPYSIVGTSCADIGYHPFVRNVVRER